MVLRLVSMALRLVSMALCTNSRIFDGKSAVHYRVLFVDDCTASRRDHAVGIHVSEVLKFIIFP